MSKFNILTTSTQDTWHYWHMHAHMHTKQLSTDSKFGSSEIWHPSSVSLTQKFICWILWFIVLSLFLCNVSLVSFLIDPPVMILNMDLFLYFCGCAMWYVGWRQWLQSLCSSLLSKLKIHTESQNFILRKYEYILQTH